MTKGSEAGMTKLLCELELRQVEQEMQNEELRLEIEKAATATALYDFAPMGYFTLSRNGTISQMNHSGFRLLGIEFPDTAGTNFRQFVGRDTQLVFNDFFRKIFEANCKQTCEVGLTTKDGRSIFVLLEGTVFEEEQKCLLTAVDITERKRMEEELRVSEQYNRTLFNQSTIGLALASMDGKLVDVNPAYSEIIGRTIDETLNLTYWNITPEKYAWQEKQQLESLKANGHYGPYEKEYIHKDGHLVPVCLQGLIIEKNGLPYIWSSVEDITERKRAGELLKASEEKLRQLIKNSFDMIVLCDPNGILHFVSESCEKILGYRQEELINIPVIQQMIHPDDQKRVVSEIQITLKKGYGGTQYRQRHKNGSWVHLEAYGTNQLNNPVVNSLVLNVRDITARKNAEDALAESEARLRKLNATKDKFFSIISHDLRSPFNSIMGYSHVLERQIQQNDYEGIATYAGIIKRSSQRVLSLLTNLMEWSRSQTGRMEFNPEYVEIVELIREATELLNDSTLQKSITISSELPHNAPVFADKEMIGTILRNLISNAIKYTHPGGTIVVSTEQKPDECLVSVRDNGIGIKKDDIEKLFRIDVSHSRKGTKDERGTGLGLILCKEFVEKHGGKIWAESEEGKGSTFCFTIPKGIATDL